MITPLLQQGAGTGLNTNAYLYLHSSLSVKTNQLPSLFSIYLLSDLHTDFASLIQQCSGNITQVFVKHLEKFILSSGLGIHLFLSGTAASAAHGFRKDEDAGDN